MSSLAKASSSGAWPLILARDVADHSAELGLQCSQSSSRALELFGVCIALLLDERVLADPRIGLPQIDAELLRKAHQAFTGAMHQPCVGRESHRLRLHRRIDDHLGEVGRLCRASARRDRKALLHKRCELLFAHALAPARHRRAVEGQLVAKKLFATEELIIGILEPAVAQSLVRKVVHVLQNCEAGHQPRRQRRLARPVVIDGAEALLQKAPVDRAGELRQRMAHVDDLVEPGLEKIVLSALASLLRSHRFTLRCSFQAE